MSSVSLKVLAQDVAQGSFTISALNHAWIALRRAKGLPDASVGSGQPLALSRDEAVEVMLVRQLVDTRVASLQRAATIVAKFRASYVGFFGDPMRGYFDHAFGQGFGFQFQSRPFDTIMQIYSLRFDHKSAAFHSALSLYYNNWALVLFARNPQSATPDLDLMVQAPFSIPRKDGKPAGDVRQVYPLYYPDALTRETHMLEGRFNGTAAALDLNIMSGAVNRLYALEGKS